MQLLPANPNPEHALSVGAEHYRERSNPMQLLPSQSSKPLLSSTNVPIPLFVAKT